MSTVWCYSEKMKLVDEHRRARGRRGCAAVGGDEDPPRGGRWAFDFQAIVKRVTNRQKADLEQRLQRRQADLQRLPAGRGRADDRCVLDECAWGR